MLRKHTLKMLAALLLTTLVSAISMAQVIYQDGNVRIIQADGYNGTDKFHVNYGWEV